MKIYKTTNLINGKIYIGQTVGNNKSYRGSGRRLILAHKKYGRNNFKFEILVDNINNLDLLDELEKTFIQYYKSDNRDIGYNLQLGGRVGKCNHSEETKKKMSLAKKGKPSKIKGIPLTKEHKRNIGLGNKGNIMSAETRKRMSASRKKRPVIQLNNYLDEIQSFESIIQAAKTLNTSPGKLHRAIVENRKCEGYKWKFKIK